MINEMVKAAERAGTLVHLDDESITQNSMALRMTQRGVPSIAVGLVSEALELLQDYSVSAFLIDRMLPLEGVPSDTKPRPNPFDAIGLIALLKSERPDVVVIVMTNFPEDESLRALVEDGSLTTTICSKNDLDAVADYVTEQMNAQSGPPGAEDSSVLRCGDYSYHLTRRVRDRPALLRQVVRAAEADTDHDVLASFHLAFQRLFRKPPHAYAVGDEDEWTRLSTLVDMERYERDYGEPEMLVGSVVALDRHEIVIEWFGGEREQFSPGTVPGRLTTAAVGDIVEATVSRTHGASKMVACSVRTPADIADPAIQQLPGLAGRPIADWPKDDTGGGGDK